MDVEFAFNHWGNLMKKFIFLADVILRFLFMVLAWYVYTNYSADNKMKCVGLSMVAFNIITMFFE